MPSPNARFYAGARHALGGRDAMPLSCPVGGFPGRVRPGRGKEASALVVAKIEEKIEEMYSVRRSWRWLGWLSATALATGVIAQSTIPAPADSDATSPDDTCTALRTQCASASAGLADRSAALTEELARTAAALREIETSDIDTNASANVLRTERRDRLIDRRATIQRELRFLDATRAAYAAAIDACETAARLRAEQAQRAGSRPEAELGTAGALAAIRAKLRQIESVGNAMDESDAIRSRRLEELHPLIRNARPQDRRLLEAERVALQAELAASRYRRACNEIESAMLGEILESEAPRVATPSTAPTTTAPAGTDEDAINKQRLAEQLEAEARDRLGYARSRLDAIEQRLIDSAPEGTQRISLQNDREYWRLVQDHEVRRLERAELQQQAAAEKQALTRLRERVAQVRQSLEQLKKADPGLRSQRREQAGTYRERATEALRQARAVDEQAEAQERQIEPLLQIYPLLDAREQALRERLSQAATLAEYEQWAGHVRTMAQQLDAERQQVHLMVATLENIIFAKIRQAASNRELARLYARCADTLDPPHRVMLRDFVARHRRIINSLIIAAAVISATYAVRLLVWLVQKTMMACRRIFGRPVSVKRLGTLAGFAGSIVKLFVWVFGVVAVFREFGIDPAKSAGAIGLIGLIMAGMFQQIVVDFVKGLDIVMGRHYNVGDFIEVAGKCGHVVDFSVKHTRIRTLSGQEYNLPNSACVPSRRFPDGFVDNYVDLTLRSASDETRAVRAIDAICPDLNRRIEALREKPEFVRAFAQSKDRVTLRYRVRVLPNCAWVVTDHFLPAARQALADESIEWVGEPSFFFINRIETFRKLFSRQLSEAQIVRETEKDQLDLPGA
jgi:small-conductance mechanosensitive channel